MSHVAELKKPPTEQKNGNHVEAVIARALAKVNGANESDLCKYIPMDEGGYIHHFTLRRMKRKEPDQLCSWIEEFILGTEQPFAVPPKQRAPRGSRKKKESVVFSPSQLEKVLNMARLSGDADLVTLLSPKKSFAQIRKDLVQIDS